MKATEAIIEVNSTHGGPNKTTNNQYQLNEAWEKVSHQPSHQRNHIQGEQTVAQQTSTLEKGPELGEIYMLEPRNLALRKTTNEPTHMITNTEVMIVDADY